ncbi:glutamate-1-semialdehyde 2,1-aminomutase [Pseudomonas sp. NFACC02]|uniref:aspartate aminotransferase family protein n=1 Tax=Pseudomonas sp. NFACC02 TaxID=1566250 RepID=UPI0008ACDA20|nr:glutamate-1-semialdehyde 2,1-aminomutase [Pseudomonas sp. NFACC02]SEQ54617.1 glutamate-1-semialdehyde 2,1-aminomutase [Pseudomonas sp. NFACC02]
MKDEISRARRVIPGGVSSPLRACRNVQTEPLVAISAKGERIRTFDGKEYTDFMYGFGPLVLGHAPAPVVEAIREQADRGMLYGTMSLPEIELAEAIVNTADFLEQIRFVCSGTEAVMSAVRLARAYTGRTKILRFKGGYHGHFDLVQNKDESHLRDAGLDPVAMRSNILVPYNDKAAVEEAFSNARGEIAAVILEPIACNMSLVVPQDGFLQELRSICDREGALLIFDEVISGFRFTYGPVSNLLGVTPDITTFGKIIGGGTPIGAFGGRREIMNLLDTEQMLQGGTFAGNPLTMAAGLATLAELAKPETYALLEYKGALLESAIHKYRTLHSLDFTFARMGSVFAFIFLPQGTVVRSHADVSLQPHDSYTIFYQEMRSRGYHLAPDVEETMYVSTANEDATLENFARDACEVIASAGGML